MTYSEAVVDKVWERARVATDLDPTVWRKDECGAWIRRDQYGSLHSDYGWKIEHTKAAAGDVEHMRAFHRDNAFNANTGSAICRVVEDHGHAGSQQHLGQPKNKCVEHG